MILKSSLPLNIGEWHFDRFEYMQYLYLPIKLPGETFLLEPRISFLSDMVNAAIKAEIILRGSVTWVEDSYLYLTLKQTFVPAEIHHNRPGWHADGFGTEDSQYIWFDKWPTEFLIGEIPVRNDDFDSMVDMCIYEDRHPSSVASPDCFYLYRIDQNHVHRTIPAPEDGVRMFIKLTFSKNIYAQKGNSINYGLDYKWDMSQRSLERNQPHL